MTIRPIASPAVAVPAPAVAHFPDFLPRNDLNNSIILDEPAYQPALRRHLGAERTTVVISEAPVGWRLTRRRAGLRVPDLLIAFDVDRASIIRQRGYSIAEHGKPPDFALEIASESAAHTDETQQLLDYANFGVPEYWLFDPEGGRFYRTHLAGYRLAGGVYYPIVIHRVDADRHWGHSDALNLDLCWEHGQLRWYDPAAGRYLRTYDDAEDDRAAAEAERDLERSARLAAEAGLRQLQDEINRLRNG